MPPVLVSVDDAHQITCLAGRMRARASMQLGLAILCRVVTSSSNRYHAGCVFAVLPDPDTTRPT